MRVLVLGGSGLLGSELLRQSVSIGASVIGTYARMQAEVPDVGWRQLDLRDRAATIRLVRSAEPDVVINAAYRQDDWTTTADGAAHAAVAAADVGARLVFVSSDAVFSGNASPYGVGAVPDPITSYGAAKAAAETAVCAVMPLAVVVRTSLIISRYRSATQFLTERGGSE